MKILIYGAGVLGSICAVRLKQAGEEVTVLARGRRLEDIRRDGIVLERFENGEQTRAETPVVERLGPDDTYDLVLVVMGMHQVPAVLPALAANRHTPNLLFLGNSVSGGGQLTAALGKQRVLRGFLLAGGTIAGGVVRWAYGEQRKAGLIIGETDGSMSPRLAKVAAVLHKTGFGVEQCKDIDAYLKTHAAMIASLGAAVYIAGGTPLMLAQNAAASALAVGGIRESLRALQALGVPLLPKGVHLYLWIPAPILMFFLRRMVRSKEVGYAFAHADKARPEIRLILDELMVLLRRSGRPMPALEELNRQFH